MVFVDVGADDMTVLVRRRLLRPNEGCFEVREGGFVFEDFELL